MPILRLVCLILAIVAFVVLAAGWFIEPHLTDPWRFMAGGFALFAAAHLPDSVPGRT